VTTDPALLAEATRSITEGSKSFAAASRLFGPESRESAVLLYAWCRHCDDVVDGQDHGHGATPEAGEGAAARLARLEEQTRRALSGGAVTEPAFAALAEVARRHAIPPLYPLQHLDGFRIDVEERPFDTLPDLLDYCYGVAGVVGVMMSHVMGARDPAVLDRACDLGLAFQLTNIARDIVDDARVGRVYLPAAWLAEAGVPRSEIAAPGHRPAIADLAARLLDTAEPYYASARLGIPALPPRARWAIATALGIYRQIGLDVRALGPRAWDRRVSTSTASKLRHVAAGTLAMRPGPFRVRPRPADLYRRPTGA
jgi:phytoene synthase